LNSPAFRAVSSSASASTDKAPHHQHHHHHHQQQQQQQEQLQLQLQPQQQQQQQFAKEMSGQQQQQQQQQQGFERWSDEKLITTAMRTSSLRELAQLQQASFLDALVSATDHQRSLVENTPINVVG
jgi:hypothetical protein